MLQTTSRYRCVLLTLLIIMSFAQAQTTLQEVRARGVLRCGSSGTTPPFSYDRNGRYEGFDVDFCRAIAAAVLGSAEAIEVMPVNAQQRFTRLHDGDYDVLLSTATATFTRDTNENDADFITPTFYDGQGLLTRARNDEGALVRRLEDIPDPTVCTVQGSTSERNLADFFALKGLPYLAIIFRNTGQAAEAFRRGICDIYSLDRSALAGQRSSFDNPEDFTLLDDVLSKEPLAPAVREGDDQWFNIVQWVVFALIQAEEWRLTQENVEANAAGNTYIGMQYMLSGQGQTMQALGLDEQAMTRAIAQVGNYGEIYNRYFGENSATPIPRGLNSLWTEGGLFYNPPFTPR